MLVQYNTMPNKIAIITACDDNQLDLLEITRPVYALYCDKHKHDFIEYKIENFDRPASWFKIPALVKTLNLGYEYVMWCDVDSLILKSDFILDNFLQHNKNLYICKDNLGINAGIFIVKNNETMLQFLQTVEAMYPRYLNGHPLDGIWEQAAIWELFAINYLNIIQNTAIVPQYILNAYDPQDKPSEVNGHVTNDTFILHLPNTSNAKRKELLLQYRQQYHNI